MRKDVLFLLTFMAFQWIIFSLIVLSQRTNNYWLFAQNEHLKNLLNKQTADSKKTKSVSPVNAFGHAKVEKELAALQFDECKPYVEELRQRKPECNRRVLPKIDPTHKFMKQSVDQMILEEDLDCFYDTAYNGAIIYLGPTKESTFMINQQPKNRTEILLVSLKRLHKYYNSLRHYPIFVFHEDYTKEDMKYFREQLGQPIHFVKVNFKSLPVCVDRVTNETLDDWMSNFENSIGYRQMCRFWSGIVQNAPILSSFEYYFRLDDDTMMYDWVNYDVFEYMVKYNKTYVYRASFADPDHGHTLSSRTLEWFKANSTKFTPEIRDHWLVEGQHNGMSPYNNFHASRFDFWKSKELGDLMQYLEDTECGFIQHAWGDANIHAVVLDSFFPASLISQVRSFPVQHNWKVKAIEGHPDAWAFDPDQPLPLSDIR